MKELQANTGITLKCELKYDNGEKHPAKYTLEGSWDQIGRAKKYFKRWFNGSADEGQEKAKKSRIHSGSRGNGIISDTAGGLGGNGRLDLQGGVGEGEGGQEEDLRRNGGSQPAAIATTENEDYHSGTRDTSSNLRSKHRSRGNGESHQGHEDVTRSRHGKDSRSSPNSSDSRSHPKSTEHSGNRQQPMPKPRHRQQEGEGGSGYPSGVENGCHILASGLATSNGVSNTPRSEHERNDTTAVPNYLLTSSADKLDGSGHLRDVKNQERPASHESDDRRKQYSTRHQQSNRYSDDHIPPVSDTRQRTLHTPEASPHSNVPLEDHESSPEGATGGQHQTPGLENINFVPVDAGVFCYIKKMHGADIRNIERKFNVKISSEDMDVNESSMLKITPVGLSTETAIRGANEAVVDLYSTVFSQLSHRVVQLEGSSIGKESLQRAIADVERLYKDVLVVLSGSKVMIYGMKELDVKVAKAMVTNRLYDTGRSAPRNHQGDRHDDDELRPDLGLEDGIRQLETQHGTRDSQNDRYLDNQVPPGSVTRESHHPRTHEDLQGFEADDEGHAEDAADREEDSSPRIPDEEPTARTEVQGSGLKYRLRHDRLSFKTAEGLKVRVYQADITKEKVGAIVNAANEALVHGGGVASAIEKAAGSLMTSECKLYIAKNGMLYPSEVIWTTAGNLLCSYVLHAVGPRWDEYKNKEECYETLKTTFLKCLEVAEKKLYVAGISMPLISSGTYTSIKFTVQYEVK